MWHGELVVNRTGDATVASLVTNRTYSWTWGGKNVSGVVEYFHNGFGQAGGCYSTRCLEDNPGLLHRIARGELFTRAVSRTVDLGEPDIEHPSFIRTDPARGAVTSYKGVLLARGAR